MLHQARFAVMAAAVFFLFVAPGFGQDAFRYEMQIGELVEPYLAHRKVNAVSIGVVSDGRIWTGNFGTLDGAGSAKPTSTTIYEIGSMSKVFTSVLLADAVASGTLELATSIDAIMTELVKSNPDVGRAITLQQLSHHTSGLPVMPDNVSPADPTNPFDGYTDAMLTESMKRVVPLRKPGAGFEYSNLGVGLLGTLLARQAKTGYEPLLKRRIIEPLKMIDTCVTVDPDRARRFAPPHNAALLPDKQWDFDALAGCGAIRSTVDDMILFLSASLNPPDNPTGKALELAWQQRKPAADGQHAMGLGWMIAGDGSTRWHNGQTGGYQSMMLASRPLKTAVVLLSNTAGSGVDALGEQIFQLAVGIDVKPKSFADEFLVDRSVAKRLEGKYQLAPGLVMTVQTSEGRMMAQLTGQSFLALTPTSTTEWKYDLVDARLTFDLPESGPSSKVTLHQAGRTMPAPRIAD